MEQIVGPGPGAAITDADADAIMQDLDAAGFQIVLKDDLRHLLSLIEHLRARDTKKPPDPSGASGKDSNAGDDALERAARVLLEMAAVDAAGYAKTKGIDQEYAASRLDNAAAAIRAMKKKPPDP